MEELKNVIDSYRKAKIQTTSRPGFGRFIQEHFQ